MVGDGHVAAVLLEAHDAGDRAQALDELVDQGLGGGACVRVGLQAADADERVEPRGEPPFPGETAIDLGQQLRVLQRAGELRGEHHERRIGRPARRVGGGEDDEPVGVVGRAEAGHQVRRPPDRPCRGDDPVVGVRVVDPMRDHARTPAQQRADA
jgi:hypothetical protein